MLASADCQGPAFSNSLRALGKELFPAYAFRELPADHPIYTLGQFSREKWTSKPGVQGLSNGVRELILLLPQADMGRVLQLNNTKARQELWQLGANIVLYAVDKRNLRYRGDSSLVALDKQVKAQRSLKLLRIQYDGNWDPEPAGWRRLANLLHNLEKIDLQIESAALGDKKLADASVAHLTGAATFQITAEEQQELKDFIEAGGTLLIDAAGGSSEFATSAEQLIKTLYPDDELKRVEPEHKLFSKRGGKLVVDYRPFARLRLVGLDDAPRIQAIERDGRPIILYSREDLSVGLVGQDVDGIIGYTPATATELMLRILMNISESQ